MDSEAALWKKIKEMYISARKVKCLTKVFTWHSQWWGCRTLFQYQLLNRPLQQWQLRHQWTWRRCQCPGKWRWSGRRVSQVQTGWLATGPEEARTAIRTGIECWPRHRVCLQSNICQNCPHCTVEATSLTFNRLITIVKMKAKVRRTTDGLACFSTVASGLLKTETETGRARTLEPPRSYMKKKNRNRFLTYVTPLVSWEIEVLPFSTLT